MKIKFLPVLFLLFSTGCANYFSTYYDGLYKESLNQDLTCATTQAITVDSSYDPITYMESEGYSFIGYTKYRGTSGSSDQASAHGKTLGACYVVFDMEYLDSTQSIIPMTSYNTYSGTANTYSYGTGTNYSTTYTGGYTSTSYVPITENYYMFTAIYFIKSYPSTKPLILR